MAMSGKGVVRAPQVWYHQFNNSMPGDELIMKCPNCGANIYDDVNRCQYCGTYQSTAKTPSVPVQAPAQPVVVNVYGQMPPPAETVEHVYHQVISAKKRPVARCFQSVGLTLAACTRTRISLIPGFGRGTSTSWRTSGPPSTSCWIARIVSFVVDISVVVIESILINAYHSASHTAASGGKLLPSRSIVEIRTCPFSGSGTS